MGWSAWLSVLGGFLANVVFGAYVASFSTLLPSIMDDVVVSHSSAGLISSSFFAGYFLSQVFFAFLAERLGQWKIISTGLLLYALSHAAFATSPSWTYMLAFRFIQGFIGGAIFIPSLQLALAVNERKRSLATGFTASGFNIGTGLGAYYSFTASNGIYWRTGLLSSTIVFAGIIPAATILTLLHKTSSKIQAESKRFESDFGFYVLNILHFIRLGVIIGVTTWMPTAFIELWGVGGDYAAFLTTVLQVAGIVALNLGGYLTDVLGKMRVLAVNFMFLALMFVLTSYIDYVVLPIFSAFLGFLIYLPTPAAFAILRDRYTSREANIAAGYLNTSAAAGALIMPYFFGQLHELFKGFHASFYTAAILYLMLLPLIKPMMTKHGPLNG